MEKVLKSEQEWREELSPEEYAVLRQPATEPPWTGAYVDTKADGTYSCAACGLELFDSDTKFESGLGLAELLPTRRTARTSSSSRTAAHGMIRTEVTLRALRARTSATSSTTAPAPTGERFCMNSARAEARRRAQPA